MCFGLPRGLPSRYTWLMKHSRFPLVLSALTLLGTSLLVNACSSSDGSSGGGGDGSCTVGGQKCAGGCDPTLGCIECSSDTQCGSPKPICVLGRCEECGTSADCGAAARCYPKDFKCDAACASDGECPGDSPHCDVPSGVCVGCLANADCTEPSKPICSAEHQQCAECGNNDDCSAAKPVCDDGDGKCKECLVDSHCPSGLSCGADAKCHFACNSNADCNDGEKVLCDLASQSCVECLDGGDCPALLPVCNGKSCVGCVSDTDCADPLTPICKGDSCVECDKDQDCVDPTKPKCDKNVCTAG